MPRQCSHKLFTLVKSSQDKSKGQMNFNLLEQSLNQIKIVYSADIQDITQMYSKLF